MRNGRKHFLLQPLGSQELGSKTGIFDCHRMLSDLYLVEGLAQ